MMNKQLIVKLKYADVEKKSWSNKKTRQRPRPVDFEDWSSLHPFLFKACTSNRQLGKGRRTCWP